MSRLPPVSFYRYCTRYDPRSRDDCDAFRVGRIGDRTIDMMLGQPFPANIENLYVFDKPFVRDDILTGKRVIVVSLPGAFTPV